MTHVTHVPGRDLHISVMNGCFLFDGRLELHHHHRQTVDIYNGIRPPVRFWPFDSHLIDDLNDVFVISRIEVQQAQMEVLDATIFADEGLAFDHAEKHTPVGTVYRQRRGVPEGADDGADLGACDALRRILGRKERREIFFDQNVCQLSMKVITGDILIVLRYELVYDTIS